MEYITSRSFQLPTDSKKIEEHDWFNMWQKQWFPYKELIEGDTLYWCTFFIAEHAERFLQRPLSKLHT